MSYRDWTGCWPALVTPFVEAKPGQVDHEALAKRTAALVSAGVDGLVACGTTGEGATLRQEELLQVLQTVKSVAGGCPVICGSGSNDTARALALTEAVAKAGADAALVVSPYYNKPPQDGVVAHYRAIAAVGLPLLVYNVPGRTGQDLSFETLRRLAELDGVIGVKDASRSMEKILRLRASSGAPFRIFSGDDFTILPALACGANGVISVVANVAPERSSALCKHFFAGDLEAARTVQTELLPLIDLLFVEANPVPVKALLAEAGWMAPQWRAPLCAPAPETMQQLRAYLKLHPELHA